MPVTGEKALQAIEAMKAYVHGGHNSDSHCDHHSHYVEVEALYYEIVMTAQITIANLMEQSEDA